MWCKYFNIANLQFKLSSWWLIFLNGVGEKVLSKCFHENWRVVTIWTVWWNQFLFLDSGILMCDISMGSVSTSINIDWHSFFTLWAKSAFAHLLMLHHHFHLLTMSVGAGMCIVVRMGFAVTQFWFEVSVPLLVRYCFSSVNCV